MRLNKDGSNHLVLHKNPKAMISHLTLDVHKKNIYWMEKDRKNYTVDIYYVSLYGGTVKQFKIKGSPDYNETTIIDTHLKVDEKYVYYVATSKDNDSYHQSLLRANKFSGEYDRDFGLWYSNPEGNYYSLEVDFTKFIILPKEPQEEEDTSGFLNWIKNIFD